MDIFILLPNHSFGGFCALLYAGTVRQLAGRDNIRLAPFWLVLKVRRLKAEKPIETGLRVSFRAPKSVITPPVNSAPRSADVVVVGAGIIGLTTALELARAGLKVCVVERGLAGREASWAAGGILSQLPPDDPVPEIRELLDESLALFPEYCAALQQQTGIDPEFWRCGATMVDASGERWFPDIAQVRNPRLLKALVSALQHENVTLLEQTPVIAWQKENGRLTGVLTGKGVIVCQWAVLAAGAWSGGLAAVPVRPVKGQMLLLKGEPGLLKHICMDEQAYVIPRRDGRVLVGSTLEEAGFDVATTPQAKAFLLDCAVRLWPQAADLEVEHQWANLRPYPDQPSPLIGPAPETPGLLLNTGHFRLGVTLSLASAKRLLLSVTA